MEQNIPRKDDWQNYMSDYNGLFDMLLDMRLGGSWVGEVDPDDLPVEMWIDWVRWYERD